MSERLEGLKRRMAQLADLAHASSLANWDQQTMMPPRGAEARAESLATLTRISHEMFVDDETGRLLEGSAAELDGADPDSDDVRLVALVRRQWEKARRVPAGAGPRDDTRGVDGPGGLDRRPGGSRTFRRSHRTWSATSSWRGGTSSVMLAATASGAPTT